MLLSPSRTSLTRQYRLVLAADARWNLLSLGFAILLRLRVTDNAVHLAWHEAVSLALHLRWLGLARGAGRQSIARCNDDKRY
jgi:hypothetical protein